jgi:hypothetical protein
MQVVTPSIVEDSSMHILYLIIYLVPLALMLLILLISVPAAIAKFTLITNIEMMKDAELIEKVISE